LISRRRRKSPDGKKTARFPNGPRGFFIERAIRAGYMTALRAAIRRVIVLFQQAKPGECTLHRSMRQRLLLSTRRFPQATGLLACLTAARAQVRSRYAGASRH